MVIDREAANVFIDGYSRLLQSVYLGQGGESGIKKLEALAEGRKAIAADVSVISAAVAELQLAGNPIPSAILDAVATLRLSQWVYLRDTTRYSVFLDINGDEAYAVQGLIQPIRSIFGGSGISFVAGLIEYDNQIVCDGIVESPVWLGPNYKKQYATLLAKAKNRGAFYV